MKFSGLLTAAAALALLGGLLWWSNRAEANKETKADPNASPKILEIPAEQIRKVEIAKGGETLVLERGDDAQYRITAPKAMLADQDAASGVFTSLTNFASDRLVEDKVPSLEPFGLAKPSLTVKVTRKDGKASTLLFGDETPTKSGFFAKLESDPRLFTVASYSKASVDRTWKDLQDKRLLTFDDAKLSRMELAGKGSAIEFGKNVNGEWQIVKPRPLRADGSVVDQLLSRLREAKMDAAVSDDDAKAAEKSFASGTPVAVARMTDAAGTQSLELRKGKDGAYFAKSSAIAGVHKMTSDLGDAMAKGLDDFRNRKLFEFGWSDPAKVEVRDGATTRTFAKSGEKWTRDGKEMDSTSVQALIDKLRELAAIKFVEKGFVEPAAIVATVTAGDGKKADRVEISKSGNSFFARRAGDASIYELDGKAVGELQQTAADVKPVAATKPDAKKK